IEGSLQVEMLERVINEIVRRHAVLRTTFATTEEGPVQVIHGFGERELAIVDLGGLEEERRWNELRELIGAEAGRSFDLAREPVRRTGLIRMTETEHVMWYTMHHIASDGWSMGVMVKEFIELYEAFSKGEPSPLAELLIQYADYAVWQRQWLQ